MEPSFNKYPRNISTNFRKLNKSTLTKILRHYKVDIPKKNATQSELAVMVGRVFGVMAVLENDVVDKFADEHCYASADSLTVAKRRAGASTRDLLDREPAAPGEQVAGKLAKADEDGGWILGSVVEYDPKTQRYLVQDEDDESRIMTLAFSEVRRLEDTASNLRRGDLVLAVFPETTSFYRAAVVKNPKPTGGSSATGGAHEVVVKFEDDEDENGRNPARRVPARFVLRRCDVETSNDSDEAPDERP